LQIILTHLESTQIKSISPENVPHHEIEPLKITEKPLFIAKNRPEKNSPEKSPL
jgi:hypothetical protein